MELNYSSDVMSQLAANGHAKEETPSTFGENWIMAVGQTIENDWSISRQIDEWTNHRFANRNQQLDALLASGELPDTYKESLGNGITYSELATIAKTKYQKSVMTDDDIHMNIREDLAGNRAMAEDVFRRAPWYAKPAQLMGTFYGYASDPINTLSMIAGIGTASKGATFLSRLAATAGREAAIGMASETAIQIPVYSWKSDIGVDYSVTDALKMIGYAAGGAAAFSGAAVTVGEFIAQGRKFINTHGIKRLLADNPAAKEARDLIEHKLIEVQDLDPKTNVAEHFQQVAEYTKAVDTAGPVRDMDVDISSKLDAEAVNESYEAQFKRAVQKEGEPVSKAEPVPYVEEVRGTGAEKEVVVGDATKEVDRLSEKLDALEKFNTCVKGV